MVKALTPSAFLFLRSLSIKIDCDRFCVYFRTALVPREKCVALSVGKVMEECNTFQLSETPWYAISEMIEELINSKNAIEWKVKYQSKRNGKKNLLYYKVKIYVKVSTYTPTKNIIKWLKSLYLHHLHTIVCWQPVILYTINYNTFVCKRTKNI